MNSNNKEACNAFAKWREDNDASLDTYNFPEDCMFAAYQAGRRSALTASVAPDQLRGTANMVAPATEQAPPLTKLIEREPTEKMLMAARKWIGQGWDWPAAIWRVMWDVARSEQAPAGEVPSETAIHNAAIEAAARRVEADCIGFAADDKQLDAIARDIRSLKREVTQ